MDECLKICKGTFANKSIVTHSHFRHFDTRSILDPSNKFFEITGVLINFVEFRRSTQAFKANEKKIA